MRAKEAVKVPETEGENLRQGEEDDLQNEEEDSLGLTGIEMHPLRKRFDIFMISCVLLAVLFIWTKIYNNPLPPIILRLLGMDDTRYA